MLYDLKNPLSEGELFHLIGIHSPPGIMRSAPPMRTGITADGVDKNGRRSGFFHKVYTRASELSCG